MCHSRGWILVGQRTFQCKMSSEAHRGEEQSKALMRSGWLGVLLLPQLNQPQEFPIQPGSMAVDPGVQTGMNPGPSPSKIWIFRFLICVIR